MIHGIIDIGSNTIRMAIYDIKGQQIDFLMKKKHMVGLAAYLENNVMSQAGIDKVCEVLFEFILPMLMLLLQLLYVIAKTARRQWQRLSAVQEYMWRLFLGIWRLNMIL